MFRITRSIGFNIISRRCDQHKQKFFIISNSTVVQENDVDIKQDSIAEVEKQDIFEGVFSKVNDVSSLLKTATKIPKIDYAFKALDMLALWYETKDISFGEVEKDQNYRKLVSVVEKQANGRSIVEIINALKNLKKMDVPSSNFLVESLENDLLWNVRKVSIHSLLLILSFQLDNLETDRQKKVLEQTVGAIERRWTEAKAPREFSLIYNYSTQFSPNFLGHIDDLVIENSENMRLNELSKILCAISVSKRRPTPVLRALAFHMFKKNDKLSPKQISNVMYALNNLNFPDEALMGKLSADFLSQIKEVDQSSIIGAILLCMGQMRWRDKDLLDALGEWVVKNNEICKSNDIARLILTLGSVNYEPENLDEILNTCSELLNYNSINDKSVWVDIVWSLIVLGKASSDQVASVLEPSFANQFPLDDPSCVGTNLKLLNINGAKAILLKSYSGPSYKLPDLNDLLITRSRKDLSLHNYVQKVLHNFLPPPKYLRENIRTNFGFVVDAELIMDKNCKPLNLADYSPDFGINTSKKDLPEGAQKIALMVWSFKDYTLGSVSLTGQNALAVKILSNLGYKVVEIPYYDVNKREKTIKSVQYFEKKIKEAMNG